MSARLLTLFVRFGADSHARRDGIVSTIADLQRLYGEQLIEAARPIVIDNALPPGDVRDEGTHWLVPGDNSRSEFSAWDRGLACARTLGLEWDVAHLVTSTFRAGYADYTRFVDGRVLDLLARTPLCVGHLDAYNHPVELFGRRSQHWVRTGWFFLSRAVVEALGSLVSVTAPERVLADDESELFRPDAPIGDAYRELVLAWLSGRDIGQGVVWHSPLADVRDHPREARRKLLAILDEHMLSVRLRESGVRTLDAIWLGHNFRRVVPPLVLAGWQPDWRTQLRERPVGALALLAGTALHLAPARAAGSARGPA